ncbi:pyrroline-5-carboxylate reductase dimerization-domain-containing protein [Aspergillus pseudocaelatus]|uniref:Pyrroline-5-carboxylate reductase dimerization-domain-containing protein n=1 Tax=Aspergillus pseudocaelatus TaxID=1825620 RepID=A0ABQ6X3T7_9EURO|nr:pyrroline-5-carboxylate reductase dimerization-domain-containing protein [Aspergillus pseudocaelatus]
MEHLNTQTLCILGHGNQGAAVLQGVPSASAERKIKSLFTRYIACAVREPDVIILGVDPSDIETVLSQPGLREALTTKLLISVAAGWTRQKLEEALYGSKTTTTNTSGRARVVRALATIAAQVSDSLTAIQISEPAVPEQYLQVANTIFEQIGKTVQVEPQLMNATVIAGGATPAFFAVVCDALIDAAVAVGLPRAIAHTVIFQSMQGIATMLQSGIHPALLKDQGTSSEGCTIGGLMILEDGAVRGHIGHEAVTLARFMETTEHVNDTRHWALPTTSGLIYRLIHCSYYIEPIYH